MSPAEPGSEAAVPARLLRDSPPDSRGCSAGCWARRPTAGADGWGRGGRARLLCSTWTTRAPRIHTHTPVPSVGLSTRPRCTLEQSHAGDVHLICKARRSPRGRKARPGSAGPGPPEPVIFLQRGSCLVRAAVSSQSSLGIQWSGHLKGCPPTYPLFTLQACADGWPRDSPPPLPENGGDTPCSSQGWGVRATT